MMRGDGSGENKARRTSEELRGVRLGSEELVLGGVSPCVIRESEDKTWSKGGSVERKKESSRKQEQVDKPMLDSNCESMEIAHSGGNLVVLQSIDRGAVVPSSSDNS